MTMTVSALKAVDPEPDPGLIEELEKLLARARRGELHGLAIVADLPVDVHVFWRGSKRFVILGGLQYLTQEIAAVIRREGEG